MNNYFGSVFTKEDINNLPEIAGDQRSNKVEELSEIQVSRDVVLGKLNGLKADKSPLCIPGYSVLGPQLFTIYINDLNEGIECNISKFADDTKLGGSVRCEEDARRLQGDLDRLVEWANAWQMQYNVDKCEVIHFGGKNRRVD